MSSALLSRVCSWRLRCNLSLKRLLYSSCDPCGAPRGRRAPWPVPMGRGGWGKLCHKAQGLHLPAGPQRGRGQAPGARGTGFTCPALTDTRLTGFLVLPSFSASPWETARARLPGTACGPRWLNTPLWRPWKWGLAEAPRRRQLPGAGFSYRKPIGPSQEHRPLVPVGHGVCIPVTGTAREAGPTGRGQHPGVAFFKHDLVTGVGITQRGARRSGRSDCSAPGRQAQVPAREGAP